MKERSDVKMGRSLTNCILSNLHLVQLFRAKYGNTYAVSRHLSGCLYSLRLLLHFSTANKVPTMFCGDVGSDRTEKERPPRVILSSLTLSCFFHPHSYISFSGSGIRAGLSTMHQLPWSAIPRWWTGRCEACDYLRRHYWFDIIQVPPLPSPPDFHPHVLPIRKINTGER